LKKKVTVIEDDPDILLSVQMALENNDFIVTALSSGRTIMSGNYEVPDLFLLDKRMPDMDGLDICRYLREKPETENIPIIVMSASPKFGEQALLAGANDFLLKPFSISDLIKIVTVNVSPAHE
jgi:CheY-like chemotaxis protein